jgi:hypothetical protein
MAIRVPLVPHPDFPSAISRAEVEVDRPASGLLQLRYHVHGPVDALVVPRPDRMPARRDELWKTTCFEAFVREGEGAGYCELNFAPSGDWAAYRFLGYREAMADAQVSEPRIAWREVGDALPGGIGVIAWLEAHVALDAAAGVPLDQPWQLALTAVIEERSGARSYWSAAHPDGKPDFHAAANFVVRLPPPR